MSHRTRLLLGEDSLDHSIIIIIYMLSADSTYNYYMSCKKQKNKAVHLLELRLPLSDRDGKSITPYVSMMGSLGIGKFALLHILIGDS